MQKKFQVLTLVCAIAAGMMGSASVLATPTLSRRGYRHRHSVYLR